VVNFLYPGTLRELKGNDSLRGLATLESRGVIEKTTAHPTLPKAWSEYYRDEAELQGRSGGKDHDV
jgi:hypothetical protein